MAGKFRLRNLLTKYPWLDRLRLNFLAGFCHFGLKIVDNSYRIIKVIAPGARPHIDGEKPCLFALCHARMVGILQVVPRSTVTLLVSRSRDGEIIARALESNGFNLARGSPAHKAIEGTMQMLRAAEAGRHLAMMVDGPRGPLHVVKPGIIRIAEMTKLPIVPFVCTGHSNWWFWGWDRFMGPLITTRMVYLIGEPLAVGENLNDEQREELRQELEKRLSNLRIMGELYWRTIGGARDNWNMPEAERNAALEKPGVPVASRR